MKKKEFLKKLKKGLAPMGGYERQRVLDYYDEMISDRIETGKTEEEAVAELGSPEYVIEKTLIEAGIDPSQKQAFFKEPDGKIKTVWLVVLIAGAPLWFGLACGLFGLAVGLFCAVIGIAAGVISACLGMVFGGFGMFVYGFYELFQSVGSGLMCISGGLVAFSLGAFLSLGIWVLSKKAFIKIKSIIKSRRKIRQ